MSKRVLLAVFCCAVALVSAHAQAPTASDELKALVEADQADRELDWSKFSPEDMEAVNARDRERRERVLEIVRAQQLTAADDYFHAALVLQHGDAPEHYLLAHVLATVAAFKGHKTGKWLSAAALDRYLASVKQDQFFGTQFYSEGLAFENLQLKPPLNGLVTDALRKEFNVPPPEETLKRWKESQGK